MRRGFVFLLGLWLTVSAQAALDLSRLQPVGPGAWVLPALAPEADAHTLGFVTNIGVIELPRGLVVLGTGTSRRFALDLLDGLRRRFNKPVVLGIVQHGGGDHVLGNGAFLSRGIALLSHRETGRFIMANCHICVSRLTAALGPGPMRGTRQIAPRRFIEGSTTLVLQGRRLRLLHFGHAQQKGGLAVWDEHSATLYAGELVVNRHVPDLQHSQLNQWLSALDALGALRPAHIVPVRGLPGDATLIDQTRGYLDALMNHMAAQFAQAASMLDAIDAAQLPQYETWPGYAERHRRNAHYAYLQRETEEFAR